MTLLAQNFAEKDSSVFENKKKSLLSGKNQFFQPKATSVNRIFHLPLVAFPEIRKGQFCLLERQFCPPYTDNLELPGVMEMLQSFIQPYLKFFKMTLTNESKFNFMLL